MQISQIENYIANFTSEQSKTLYELSQSDDKKEMKDLHKKLKSITTILNSLIVFKGLIFD